MRDQADARDRNELRIDRSSPVPLAAAAKLAPVTTILAPPAPVRHARSTLLLGSIASVRDAGRFGAYIARLPAAHHDVLLNAVAGTWIPIRIAFAHYDTCDSLGFPPDQQVQNGRSTFDKTRVTIAGTVTRMAKGAGMTPWSVFPHFQRFWARGFDGGGLSIVELGPKEARLELVACRLADSPYYRNALRGLVTAVTELFSRKVYMTETPGYRAPAAVSYRVQWV